MAKKTKTFTARTEPDARKALADWKKLHPKAVVTEGKPVRSTTLAGDPHLVTIPIEYEE